MKWEDMDFKDKLLFFWEKIEFYHYCWIKSGLLKYRWQRDFFKAILKKTLGIICNEVYD